MIVGITAVPTEIVLNTISTVLRAHRILGLFQAATCRKRARRNIEMECKEINRLIRLMDLAVAKCVH